MSQVYSNSPLNLVAVDSPDGHTGLLFDNRPYLPSAWKVTFRDTGRAPQARTNWQHEEELRQLAWNCINLKTRALINESQSASRAWTLQEHLLPPRSLYFGRDQIVWKSRAGNVYEALPGMFDEGIVRLSPGSLSRNLQESKPFANKHNVQQWPELVQKYSKGNLSSSRDKLVAIPRLAHIFAPLYNSKYVVGLWVKHIIRLLA